MNAAVRVIRDSEGWYVASMQVIGSLCVFVSLLTVFLILRHSTREMQHYKWLLLTETIWSCNFGLLMGLLWIPVPLFPSMAAYIRGPLQVLGRNGAHVIMCLLSGSAFAIVNCLFLALLFRYATVARLPIYHLMTRKAFAPIVVVVNLTGFATGFCLNFVAHVPFSVLQSDMFLNHWQLAEIFEVEIVFGYVEAENPLVVAYGVGSLVYVGVFSVGSIVLIHLLLTSLRSQKQLMAKQNFSMQLSLFTSLAVQFCIPFLFGVVPITVVTVLVQLSVDDVTVLCELCLLSGCLHTVLFNLTTVLFVKPYRIALCFYFGLLVLFVTGKRPPWGRFKSAVPLQLTESRSKSKSRNKVTQVPAVRVTLAVSAIELVPVK